MGRWPGECVAKEADSTRQGTGVQIQLRKGKAVASEGQGNQYRQGVGIRVSSCDDRRQDNLQKLSVLFFSSSMKHIQFLGKQLPS